ncbi:PAS domain-containing protein [Pyxidicoccus fallax]|uniref:histidine kinase n=1 Tax=Pyxidicoccus fallax TaxID=394095 RepID=A0A848L6A5_9BACT|nr:ATP-binding protein [Pyxidicoccus fallax]NMO14259.1 PAS domain-containing protein [Pyxidicoccus fallax]NPC80034.1 PAS domain-containing protein [Pyxidicoccus fallax]
MRFGEDLARLRSGLMLRIGLLLSLFLLFLSVSQGLMAEVARAKRADAAMLNVAGSLRLLAERYTRETNLALVGLSQRDWPLLLKERSAAQATARQFHERTHALLDGGPTELGGLWVSVPPMRDTDLRGPLSAIEAGFRELEHAGVMALRAERSALTHNPHINRIQHKSDELVEQTDRYVALLQTRSDQRLARLRWLQGGTLLAGLGLFVVLLLFVYHRVVLPLDASVRSVRRSEEMHRDLYEGALVGLWQVSGGRFARANRLAATLFGKAEARELEGESLEEVLGAAASPLRARLASERTVAEYEFERSDESGQRRFLALSACQSPDGALIEGTVVDVTPRRRAEEALRRTQARLLAAAHRAGQQQIVSSLVEYSQSLIFVKDMRGRYLSVNRRVEELLCANGREALIGRTDAELFPPEEAKRFVEADHQVFETQATLEYEEAFPLPDGRHTYLVQKFPLKDATGAIYAVCGIATDISERKRAEESLRLLSDTSRQLASSLDFDVTLDTVAHLLVPALARTCVLLVREHGPGESPHWRAVLADAGTGEGQRRRARDVDVTPEQLDRWLEAVRGGDGACTATRVPGDAPAWVTPLRVRGEVLGLYVLTPEPGRPPYSEAELALIEEVSQRGGLAIDAARLYRRSREATQAREEFLSIASHELKTPLTSLKLHLQSVEREALRARPAPESARVTRLLRLADRQLNRLREHIDNLLDVSRILTGRMELHFGDVELTEVVDEVLAGFNEELARERIAIRFEHDGAIHGRWDRPRIEQVVANLVGNAIKYGEQRPVRVSVQAREERVRLLVQDHGPGIAAKDRERIFQVFERAVRGTNISGFGLGLYVTRQIVQAHGGAIQVEDTQGGGATFVVELPADSESPPEPAGRRPHPVLEAGESQSMA